MKAFAWIACAAALALLAADAGAQSAPASWAAPALAAARPAPAVSAKSWAALDEKGALVAGRDPDTARPIASITKLMMAMVYADKGLDMRLTEEIAEADVDSLKHSSSRLAVGTRLSRFDLMRLALASSENRAASALARGYPGGTEAMVAAMNAKAKALGMSSAHFQEPTGLSPMNVASARDVAKMAMAARGYVAARQAANLASYAQTVASPDSAAVATLSYKNTNKMLREGKLAPDVSKTGYIKEAGKCLAWALSQDENRYFAIALLDAPSFDARDADELRLSAWVQGQPEPEIAAAALDKPKAKSKRSSRRHA